MYVGISASLFYIQLNSHVLVSCVHMCGMFVDIISQRSESVQGPDIQFTPQTFLCHSLQSRPTPTLFIYPTKDDNFVYSFSIFWSAIQARACFSADVTNTLLFTPCWASQKRLNIPILGPILGHWHNLMVHLCRQLTFKYRIVKNGSKYLFFEICDPLKLLNNKMTADKHKAFV